MNQYNHFAPVGSHYPELYGQNGGQGYPQQPAQVPSNPPASAPPEYYNNGASAPPLYTNALPPPYHHVAAPQQHFAYAAPAQQQPIPQAVHSCTLALLRIASDQANAILGKKREDLNSYNQYASQQSSHQYPAQYSGFNRPLCARSVAPVTVVQQSSYVDNSWNTFNLGSGRTVHHHHHHPSRPVGNGRDQQRDNNDAIRVVVGLVSVVVIFVGAFFVGKAMAASEDAHEEALSYNDLKDRWNTNGFSINPNKFSYPAQYQVHVDNIIRRVESIFARQRTNRMQNVALLIGTLAAAGAAFGGAVVGSGTWMAAGTLLGAGVLGLSIIKLGYRCVSQGAKRDAKAINDEFDLLNRQPPLLIEA